MENDAGEDDIEIIDDEIEIDEDDEYDINVDDDDDIDGAVAMVLHDDRKGHTRPATASSTDDDGRRLRSYILRLEAMIYDDIDVGPSFVDFRPSPRTGGGRRRRRRRGGAE